jgi:CRISPR/Cas system-associated exonuclease Cas4 (RecB family)
VITPRITRLVRVPDLRAMHHAIAQRACRIPDARACAVLVPSRGAAEALRRTLENIQLNAASPALLLPDLMTRAELYEKLHERLPGAPPMLTDFEREVIFRRAALDAAARGTPAPFRLRPGLIVEILAFYDELRRRDKTVAAFERLMVASLEPSAGIDRGAERLLRLTRFLSAAFEVFERRIAETGRVDEHGLRGRLIETPYAPDTVSGARTEAGVRPQSSDYTHPGWNQAAPYRHVVVTVADQSADPRGLWLADYDLLARMPGLERLDVIATENVLAAGFHQRVHDVLPGIEEERIGTPAPPPLLSAPEPAPGGDAHRWIVCRDREEELVEIARALKRGPAVPLERTAVVFQRPLPYLYLARQVFPDAQVPYQALDALPLAAEPFAAALDLILSFVIAEGTRASLVELLASPHWKFEVDGNVVGRSDVAAADGLLRDVKYVGGWERLSSLAAETDRARGRASTALRAAAAAGAELRAMIDAPSASQQVSALLAFVAAHERRPRPADEWYPRHLRARAAVLAALESLRDAHRLHDDEPVAIAELSGTVRRWIEGQTFSPRTGTRGLTLVDAPAAAYADVDELRLVGLVESDWPDRSRRGIFYPSSLLTQLGWPTDADRLSAARARFHDLLRLAKTRVTVSLFTLEDDAIVPASPFLEELDEAGLSIERTPAPSPSRVFVHEALAQEPVVASALTGTPLEWLALRASRSPAAGGMFHGDAGTREAGVYAVSHVERYLECPFKYFATYVLRLPEERDEESGLTPQERGQFLHEVFQQFFVEWQASGCGSMTTENVGDAVVLFERVAEAHLATLSESDRALERTHLLGSAAAPGLAERAFAFEIEQGGEVVERLLEHELKGQFVFTTAAGPRSVHLRAKADRIDLLADGTLRVVDYKLGKAPKAARALQLPVYGVCAQQSLEGRHGRSWTLGRAGYVAFREKNPFVGLGTSTSLAEAVGAGQERLLAAIDAIERGEFPPRPDEPFICTRCGYASVCRKDYVGDE